MKWVQTFVGKNGGNGWSAGFQKFGKTSSTRVWGGSEDGD